MRRMLLTRPVPELAGRHIVAAHELLGHVTRRRETAKSAYGSEPPGDVFYIITEKMNGYLCQIHVVDFVNKLLSR